MTTTWTYALIVLAGLGQGPVSDRDAAAIEAARRVQVQSIDPALPRLSFDAWLRGIVGAEASTTWEVNDCGEQSGSAAQDAGRDLPLCAEIQVGLSGQRELHVQLAVGSLKRGVEGAPRFWWAYLRRSDGALESIRGLAAIPPAIR